MTKSIYRRPVTVAGRLAEATVYLQPDHRHSPRTDKGAVVGIPTGTVVPYITLYESRGESECIIDCRYFSSSKEFFRLVLIDFYVVYGFNRFTKTEISM